MHSFLYYIALVLFVFIGIVVFFYQLLIKIRKAIKKEFPAEVDLIRHQEPNITESSASELSNDLLRQQAESGDAISQLALAKAFANGTGVEQSFSEAARWCHKASQQGLPEAVYIMSENYRLGLGVPKDEQMAKLLRARTSFTPLKDNHIREQRHDKAKSFLHVTAAFIAYTLLSIVLTILFFMLLITILCSQFHPY
ncbi:tetratricopeptide repeat protein [Leeia oryzae]|uniref:tetratricopeptide repeat protein n=1 Tax=Leeia oryzae TaxID=356662 RepID=UPI000381A6D9|nr:tetratricopeptide repeat protein [Leeia oryzae]